MSQKTKATKDELIRKTGSIADAFSVFIAAGGNIAVWILFACMIVSIVNAAVEFPAAISLTIMLVQAVVLDIAGFGLQTIAKRLLKVNDVEVRRAATEGKRLAGLLITMMIVTIVLVSGKTIAPAVFTDHNLVAKIQQYIDITDKVLILARIGLTVMYTHTIHNLRDTESEMMEAEEKQTEANDKLALSNQQKIEESDRRLHELSTVVDTLASSVHTLVDKVENLSTEQDHVHKNVDMAVDTLKNRVDREEFEQLARTVNIMSGSVNQTNQSVLQITQNLYNVSPSQPLARVVEEVHSTLPETAESRRSDSRNTLPVPVLEVPGVSSEKVQSVINAFLSGTGWRQMPGNYSRTIKPIRDAFEASQNTENTDVYTHVDA